MEAPLIVTTHQLAQLLQTSARSVQRMVAEGTLRAYKVRARGGWRFVLAEALEDLGRNASDLPVWTLKVRRIKEIHEEAEAEKPGRADS